jgi:Methionyl-tRNA synthetase
VNVDLSNNYGNLIQRISSFIINNNDCKISKPSNYNEDDKNLLKSFDHTFDNYIKSYDII